jgi:hypothetical protein
VPAASGRPLIADPALVTFIDAAGLGLLASAASRAVPRGPSLQRYAPSTRSGGCSPSPAWTARSRSPAS